MLYAQPDCCNGVLITWYYYKLFKSLSKTTYGSVLSLLFNTPTTTFQPLHFSISTNRATDAGKTTHILPMGDKRWKRWNSKHIVRSKHRVLMIRITKVIVFPSLQSSRSGLSKIVATIQTEWSLTPLLKATTIFSKPFKVWQPFQTYLYS